MRVALRVLLEQQQEWLTMRIAAFEEQLANAVERERVAAGNVEHLREQLLEIREQWDAVAEALCAGWRP